MLGEGDRVRLASVHAIAVFPIAVIAATVALFAPPGTEASRSSRSVPAVQALLVSEQLAAGVSQRVSIISLAGKKLAVPGRLQKLRWGDWALSPDARFVAWFAQLSSRPGGGVLVGPLRGGTMQTVLRDPCRPSCGYWPTYAWGPDSRLLAVSAGALEEPQVLRLVDVNGRVVKSFSMPNAVTEWGGKVRVTYRVVSWPPDGSRLLLLRSDRYGPSAVVVLEVGTGKWHRVAGVRRFSGCDHPKLAWSPDGRLIALSSHGTQDCLDLFALIDALHAKTLISEEWEDELGDGRPVWAVDGKSVFIRTTPVSGQPLEGIDRIYLTGERVNVIEPTADGATPRVALATGLIYDAANALYLHHFATGETKRLMPLRSGSRMIEPLQRLP